MTKNATVSRFVLAFMAGFLAVVLFHQSLLALLHAVNFTPRSAYPTEPTQPFGIPQIWSLAFWGGLWGVVFATIAGRFRLEKSYWLAAVLFGAIAPTLVAWIVVAPLKNQPIAGDWKPVTMLTGLLLNGAWGVGTALLLKLFSRTQMLNR